MTILTKVMVPVRRPGWVRRPRLLDQLFRCLDYKVTLLTATAGYGKTTLLTDFAHEVELPVCWLTLDPDDVDPAQFLAGLALSLAQRFPGVGGPTRAALAAGMPPDAVVGVLVNELVEAVPELCVLILDDFHEADAAEIGALLDRLLRFLPPHVHVILSSRSVPPVDLIRLAAKQEIIALPPRELCFTAGETADLLERSFNLSVRAADAEALAQRMGGWVTGIVLATQQMTRQLAYRHALAQGDLDVVYAYLAREVLGQQPPHVRDFLLQTAVLRSMTVDLCNALLHRDDAAQIFRTLEAQHLFIERIGAEDGDVGFRYHPLFHEFLLGQLAGWDPGRLDSLRRTAAQLYEGAGDRETAVRLYLEAGDLAAAAPVMNALAVDLYNRGRYATLLEWHTRLGAQGDAAPMLQIQVAKAWFARGDYARALAALDAVESSPAGLEVLPEVWLQRGFIWYRQGQIEPAVEALQPILEADANRGLQAYALRILGLCRQKQGRVREAQDHLLQALDLYRQLGDLPDQSRVLTDLSSVAFALGHDHERLDYQHRALEIARRHGQPHDLVMPLNNAAYGQHLAGDLEAADRLYQEALACAGQAGRPRDEAWVLLGRADLLADAGQCGAAAGLFRRAVELARPAGEPFIVEYASLGLAACARLAGDRDEAAAWLERVSATSSAAGWRYQLERGLLLLAGGDRPAAQAAFAQARDGWTPERDRGELAIAELCLAEAERQLGDEPAALRSLKRALAADGRCAQRGARFAVQARRLPALLALGRAHDVDPPALDQLDQRLRALERSAGLVAGPAGPAPEAAFQVFALGTGRILQDGVEIAAADWQRAAARSLFFFVVDRPRVQRDELCRHFWPDVPENKARSRFYAALHDARRTAGKDRLQYLQDESAYRVDLSDGAVYDVAAFEEAIAGARPLAAGEERLARLGRAVALYAGPYLADMDDDWVIERRRELESLYLQALVDLGDCGCTLERPGEAESWYRQALELDTYREDIHRKVMLALVQGGRRAEALRQYEVCAGILRAELGVEPDPATRALADDIRRS